MAKANPKAVNCKLVLTGGREGKTVRVGNIVFRDGIGTAYAPDHKGLEGVVRYMARSYQAYREGSPELAAYQKRKAEEAPTLTPTPTPTAVVTTEGSPDATKTETSPSGSGGVGTDVPSGSQSGSDGSSEVPTSDDSGNGNASVDGTEPVPGGHGHEHTGVRGTEGNRGNIQAAALKLDPANDEHWTAEGLPKVDAIATIANIQALTRAEVEEAVPGMMRPRQG